MRRAFALVVLVLCTPASILAWGTQGHRVVATLASQRLSPAARAQVEALLRDNRDGKSLPSISMWADAVRFRQLPETARWHFVNIPLGRTYDSGRDCRNVYGKGDCVVAALQRMRDALADRSTSHGDRVEALKFVVHLAADLHQPLHVAERDGDAGATRVEVSWFGRWQRVQRGRRQDWTLHAVWDDGLIEETYDNAGQHVRHLNEWLATQDEANVRAGTVVDWTMEAHRVAREQAYLDADGSSLPRRGARLGAEYRDARIAALDRQLARAGVRLARMLNEALD